MKLITLSIVITALTASCGMPVSVKYKQDQTEVGYSSKGGLSIVQESPPTK